METLEAILAEVEVFRGMQPEHLSLISGCAANVRFEAGEFAGRAGEPADRFWVVRQGRMALQLYVPGRGTITVASLSENDVVGFCWLLPPYFLRFDVQALMATRALIFDGRCLRGKCATDPALGYELLTRFSKIMVSRIEALSLQLLDVYGDRTSESD